MLKYLKTKSPYDCFGCNACEQICGHDAIHMVADDEGFRYPTLNHNKCIGCGLCEKVCPIEHYEPTINQLGETCAAQFNDNAILKNSSSGGMFYAIAKYVMGKGGLVYGASFNDKNEILHRRIDRISDIYPLMGSKYVQSNTESTYRQVRADLKNGLLVYYTGTPCQISGLRLFLMKDYENLITSDLICHGTPSQKIFSNMITHIESRYNGKVINYSFRDKNVRGWAIASSSVIKTREKIKYLKYSNDMEAYFNAFSKGALMRRACYQCTFSQPQRVGDITLADFWGVREKLPDMKNISKGISLILINTTKGADILQKIKNNLTIEQIPMEWATETNSNLVQPTPEPLIRNEAYILAFNDYNRFVNMFGGSNETKNRIKRELESFVRSHEFIFHLVSKTLRLIKRK